MAKNTDQAQPKTELSTKPALDATQGSSPKESPTKESSQQKAKEAQVEAVGQVSTTPEGEAPKEAAALEPVETAPAEGKPADSTPDAVASAKPTDATKEAAPLEPAAGTSTPEKSAVNPKEAIEEGSPEELEEQAVKQAFLSRFRKKKSTQSKQSTETLKDPTLQVAQLSPEEVRKKLYEEMAQTRAKDYVVLRLHKKSLLMVSGILLLLLWLGLGVSVAYMTFDGQARLTKLWNMTPWGSNEDQNAMAEQISVMVDERVANRDVPIRIRNNGAENLAKALADYLYSIGYNQIELLADESGDYEGVSIVTKTAGTELKEELESVIGEVYAISSPAAELTNDSQVDAVILFGAGSGPDSLGAVQALLQSNTLNEEISSEELIEETAGEVDTSELE